MKTVDEIVREAMAPGLAALHARDSELAELVEAQAATLGEGIDTATPAGRLQLHILGAIAEFERARIQERVRAGVARVRAAGPRAGSPPRERSS